jgi:cob(I)alamin adenosyltransferase
MRILLKQQTEAKMKVYTKGGDKGQTSLLGGMRLPKSDIRIHAYGTVDELNSYIGLLADQPINQARVELLRQVQNVLFTMGSHLAATPDYDSEKLPRPAANLVEQLELAIDEMDAKLPELRSFLLPGGHHSVSFCHIARSVARRAERMVVALHQQEPIDGWIITYLNRLSDYLFVLARMMTQELDVREIPWKSEP